MRTKILSMVVAAVCVPAMAVLLLPATGQPGSLASGSVEAGATALPVGEGCPICWSDWWCGTAEEGTPHASCWYNEQDLCEADQGSCVLGTMLMSPPFRQETLEFNGIEYRGDFVAEVEGMTMNIVGVGDGLFARWDCGGSVTDVFRRDEQGNWTSLDAALYADRLNLTFPATTE